MFGTVAVQIWLLEEDLYGGSCLIYINRSTGQRALLPTPTNLQWCAICSHNCHFLKALSFKPDNEQAPLHSVHRAMPLAQVLSGPCMQSTWLIKLLLVFLRQTRQDWGLHPMGYDWDRYTLSGFSEKQCLNWVHFGSTQQAFHVSPNNEPNGIHHKWHNMGYYLLLLWKFSTCASTSWTPY